LEKLNNKPFTV